MNTPHSYLSEEDIIDPEKNWCFVLAPESIGGLDKLGYIRPAIVRASGEPIYLTGLEVYTGFDKRKSNRLIKKMNLRIGRTKEQIDEIIRLSQTNVQQQNEIN